MQSQEGLSVCLSVGRSWGGCTLRRREGTRLGFEGGFNDVSAAAAGGGGLSVVSTNKRRGLGEAPSLHTPCRHPPAGGEKMSDEGQIRELRLNLSRS